MRGPVTRAAWLELWRKRRVAWGLGGTARRQVEEPGTFVKNNAVFDIDYF